MFPLPPPAFIALIIPFGENISCSKCHPYSVFPFSGFTIFIYYNLRLSIAPPIQDKHGHRPSAEYILPLCGELHSPVVTMFPISITFFIAYLNYSCRCVCSAPNKVCKAVLRILIFNRPASSVRHRVQRENFLHTPKSNSSIARSGGVRLESWGSILRWI